MTARKSRLAYQIGRLWVYNQILDYTDYVNGIEVWPILNGALLDGGKHKCRLQCRVLFRNYAFQAGRKSGVANLSYLLLQLRRHRLYKQLSSRKSQALG